MVIQAVFGYFGSHPSNRMPRENGALHLPMVSRKAFEVILVPLDVDEKLWELHMSKMPWLSIPVKNRDAWWRLRWWEWAYGGFLTHGVPPVIIHFSQIFPNKNHPFLGIPMVMESPISVGSEGKGYPSSAWRCHLYNHDLGDLTLIGTMRIVRGILPSPNVLWNISGSWNTYETHMKHIK